jgi:hypothetical protein
MIRPNYLPPTHSLAGRDGELVLIRITVEPRLLERLIEALGETSYHINPQVFPNSPAGALVEFPAYESWIGLIGDAVKREGLEPAGFEAVRMITKLAS